tara:strand:+ start:247 stop:462 length:216 start_codon:yes stop_codon:yes gene_type:complete
MIIPLYNLKEMTHLKGMKDHISSKIKQLAFTKFKTLPEQDIKNKILEDVDNCYTHDLETVLWEEFRNELES